jgi:tetratricopeptide (TPR) repeat protein
VYQYSREDLVRILRVTARQLAAWERADLLTPADSYTFFGLLQVKKVRDLCARHVRPVEIRQSVTAMQKQAAGMENPLLEASAFMSGRHRVAFRHDGRLLEPIAGQFMLDFAGNEKVVTSVPAARSSHAPSPASDEQVSGDVAELFARGVGLEEDPRNQLQAIAVYERVLELDPQHAAAHINLGTLYYNRQEYNAAEDHYRKAIHIDPRYALAHFDLGNVLDETGRVADAIQTYLSALQLGSYLCRCPLQCGFGLRKNEGAAQGAQALAGLCKAGRHRAVVGACPRPGQANSEVGLAEAGARRARGIQT